MRLAALRPGEVPGHRDAQPRLPDGLAASGTGQVSAWSMMALEAISGAADIGQIQHADALQHGVRPLQKSFHSFGYLWRKNLSHTVH